MTVYNAVPGRPLPALPPYGPVNGSTNGVKWGTDQGPFTAADYASWWRLPLLVAQAVLDKAVVDGDLT